MKKTLLLLSLVAFATTGCTKTWSGIKQDSKELFSDTVEVIHEATAPEVIPEAKPNTMMIKTEPKIPEEPAPEVITPII